MDAEDVFLLLTGAVIGGLAVYMLFFKPQSYVQSYAQTDAMVYRPVAVNKEVWRWKDWKGRDREITVSREVKQLE